MPGIREDDITVSVVIPTYNRAEMLREALGSVMAQTVPVLDIAVVDDGSTDHTADLVRGYQRGGAPIVFLPGPHRDRLGEARNRGVAATRGKWIAFLDSDDIWLPARVERQLAGLAHVPGAEFAFCNVQRFNEAGDIGGPYLDPSEDYSGPVTARLLEEPVALPSALMVSRSAFEDLGGFADRSINEDYELTLLLSVRGPASYVPDVLVRMRAHGGSRSLAQQKLANLEYLRIVHAFLKANPTLPREARAAARRAVLNVHHKLARLYAEEGDRTRARRHLRMCIRLRPFSRRAAGLTADLYLSNLPLWKSNRER
jgi:glycosyltransferase involved in cell wall biosynthesis